MDLYIQFFIILFSFSHFQASEKMDLLDSYQWKNRLVIINGESKNSSEQLMVFKGLEEEITDRDIRLIQIFKEKVIINDKTEPGILPELLRENLQLSDQFACLLIGKDGGIKLRSSSLVDAETIFQLVDSMPMRQAEVMRKN